MPAVFYLRRGVTFYCRVKQTLMNDIEIKATIERVDGSRKKAGLQHDASAHAAVGQHGNLDVKHQRFLDHIVPKDERGRIRLNTAPPLRRTSMAPSGWPLPSV